MSLLRLRRLFIGEEGTGLPFPSPHPGRRRKGGIVIFPTGGKTGTKKSESNHCFTFLRKIFYKKLFFIRAHAPGHMLQNQKCNGKAWGNAIRLLDFPDFHPNKKSTCKDVFLLLLLLRLSQWPVSPTIPASLPPKKRKFLPPLSPKLRTQSNREAGRRSRAVEITRGPPPRLCKKSVIRFFLQGSSRPPMSAAQYIYPAQSWRKKSELKKEKGKKWAGRRGTVTRRRKKTLVGVPSGQGQGWRGKKRFGGSGRKRKKNLGPRSLSLGLPFSFLPSLSFLPPPSPLLWFCPPPPVLWRRRHTSGAGFTQGTC